MHEPDQEKTTFITPRSLFYYKVMLFGLKNARATYQRIITKMFVHWMGKIMVAYINDMVVKSKKVPNHLQDLAEVFEILKEHNLRLNATKCTFGVRSRKFLGHLVTWQGIETNIEKIVAINYLVSSRTMKEVKKLTKMAVILNRFISKSFDKCHPFFSTPSKKYNFFME